MALTLEQIRELVLEGESNHLDFKREQYHFVGLSGPDGDKEKAKLLKDVLAFANAFRKDPAFILVGVDESLPRDQSVAGIPSQDVIDDATLQQFVNSKTNRPIPFRAYTVSCSDSRVVEVLEIDPCANDRPFYLKKGFGGILQEEVWFRSGSSNTKATPDDIYRMGLTTLPRQKTPVLNCELVSPNLIPGTDQLLVLEVHPLATGDEYSQMSYNALARIRNEATYMDMIEWLTQVLGCVHFTVSITNDSTITAEKIYVETKIEPEIPGSFEPCRLVDLFERKREWDPDRPSIRVRDPSVVRPEQTEKGLGLISGRMSGTGSFLVTAFVYGDNMPRIKIEKRFSLLRSSFDIPNNKLPEEYTRFGNPLTLFPFLRSEASKMKAALDDIMEKCRSGSSDETK